MTDLLTKDETEHAAKQGWLLSYVFDQGTSKWLVEVLPVKDNRVRSARHMQTVVMNLARNRDPVALRAMSLVMAGIIPTKATKRKKT